MSSISILNDMTSTETKTITFGDKKCKNDTMVKNYAIIKSKNIEAGIINKLVNKTEHYHISNIDDYKSTFNTNSKKIKFKRIDQLIDEENILHSSIF